ncbi:putative GTP pyrophosphokinase [Lachnospiraceae bacterium C7]|nr:putative GTP pyrophosphokinase [Lachnospiraceae bacterium C7]
MNEIITEVRDEWIRENLLSDKVLDAINSNLMPIEKFMAYYRCAAMEVETKFKILNEQCSLQYDRNPIESIKTRIKSIESILKKINRKKVPLNLEAIAENISDIAGVRVICSFVDDIYMLAEYLLQQDDVTLIRKKDYIKNPKESGYRSLHLIVEVPIFLENQKRSMKVEVQLRTIAMDFWASLEHKLRYKKNIPSSEAEALAKELEECATISAGLDSKMEKIRDRMNKYYKEDDMSDVDVEEYVSSIINSASTPNVQNTQSITQQSQNIAQQTQNMITYNSRNDIIG